MKTVWMIAILLACGLAETADAQQSKNFQTDTPEYARALEVARHSNAWYWAEQELPNWSAPATVRVKKGEPDHGQTDFLIANGEVTNWNMMLAGDSWGIHANVIPHEVNHAVWYSVCRRKIPRWLDEGAASMRESDVLEELFPRLHRQNFPDGRVWALLDATEYPSGMTDLMDLYAEGTALTCYLHETHGRQKLIELAKCGAPSRHWRRIIGEDPHTTRRKLTDWIVTQRYTKTIQKTRRLYIWSGKNCAPCENFWRAYDRDQKMRKWLHRRWHVIYVTADATAEMAAHGVDRIPAFGNPEMGYVFGFESAKISDWRDSVEAVMAGKKRSANYPIQNQQSCQPGGYCPPGQYCQPIGYQPAPVRIRPEIRQPMLGIGIPVGPPRVVGTVEPYPPTQYQPAPPQTYNPAPQNPVVVPGISQEQVTNAVEDYLRRNPVSGEPGPPGDTGPAGPPPSEGQIAEIIEDALIRNAERFRGPPGPPGPGPTEQQLVAAAERVVEENPDRFRGLVGVPDNQDIRNWLIGAAADPQIRQLLAQSMADILQSDTRVMDLIRRLEIIEGRLGQGTPPRPPGSTPPTPPDTGWPQDDYAPRPARSATTAPAPPSEPFDEVGRGPPQRAPTAASEETPTDEPGALRRVAGATGSVVKNAAITAAEWTASNALIAGLGLATGGLAVPAGAMALRALRRSRAKRASVTQVPAPPETVRKNPDGPENTEKPVVVTAEQSVQLAGEPKDHVANTTEQAPKKQLKGAKSTAESPKQSQTQQQADYEITRLPLQDVDYTTVWADHWRSQQLDPLIEARNLGYYVDALTEIEQGRIKLPGVDNPKMFVDSARNWVTRQFVEKVARTPENDNFNHRAFYGYLHRQLVDFVRQGTFANIAPSPKAADAIEDFVNSKIVEKLGVVKCQVTHQSSPPLQQTA